MTYIETEGPSASPRYWEVMNELTVYDSERAKVFYGGPLDFGENGPESWLVPVEVTGRDQHEQYHVMYQNCEPGATPSVDTEVIVLEADDAIIKATDDRSETRQIIDGLLRDTEVPRIVIRRARTGMLYYPRVSVPPVTTEAPDSIDVLLETMQIEPKQVNMRELQKIGLPISTELTDEMTIVTRKIEAEGRQIFVHQTWLQDDLWEYYELYSAVPLREIAVENTTPVRIDSGCDIGELYNDHGCECREQFHLGVRDAIDEGGLIVHIPGHDGRGYGMVTKMETEGLKRGIVVATNQANPVPMDTLQAAKNLLGDKFDIRTYTGAARIIRALGIFGVELFTDNRRKVADLEAEGLLVIREKTNTTGANGSHHHVKAKHQYGEIYFDHE